MSVETQVLGMWRTGMDTYDISKLISKHAGTPIREAEVHRIITAERNERKARLGFKTIEGGRNENSASRT